MGLASGVHKVQVGIGAGRADVASMRCGSAWWWCRGTASSATRADTGRGSTGRRPEAGSALLQGSELGTKAGHS